MLLFDFVSVVTLEGSAEGELEAHDCGEDGLAGLAFAFHRNALVLAGCGLDNDLEEPIAVGV